MSRFACLLLAVIAPMPCMIPGALAQTFTAPRFEALERQQQAVEQQQLDAIEQERTRIILGQSPVPGTGLNASAADSAIRRLELTREADTIRIEGDLRRDRIAREEALTAASLPNRRIARTSVLAVDDPAAAGLAEAPRGQFYALLEGRFVLVDETSELVVAIVSPPGQPVASPPLSSSGTLTVEKGTSLQNGSCAAPFLPPHLCTVSTSERR